MAKKRSRARTEKDTNPRTEPTMDCYRCEGTGDKLLRAAVPVALKQQCPECRGVGQVPDLSVYEQMLDADMGIGLEANLVVEFPYETAKNEDGEVVDATTHDSPLSRTVEYRIGGDLVTRRVFERVLAMAQKKGG